MAPEIMGNRFISRNLPAWHWIGTVFTSGVKTATEGLTMLGEPIKISKLPYVVNIPGHGAWEFGDQFMLVRHPTADDPQPRSFGEVTDRYALLQNEQIAQLMDILLANSDWQLETGGILHNGATIFFAARGDTSTVCGDEIGMYFTLSDQRSGKAALDLTIGLVRVVCNNTLQFSLGTNKARITIPHHSDLFKETAWRMEIISQAAAAGKSMVAALQNIASVDVTEDILDGALRVLFPEKKMPRAMDLLMSNDAVLVERGESARYHHEWKKEAAEKAKVEIIANFEYLSESYGRTGWALMNAFTGWVDHQSGKDTANGRRVMAERALTPEMDAKRGALVEYLQNAR